MIRLTCNSLRRLICFSVLASMLVGTVPAPSVASPPAWAPAHGWRKKHDPAHVGYQGRKWRNDYGILAGHCNRSAIGAVLGGAVGGAIGATVSSNETRVAAIVVGTVIGTVVGSEIGRNLDAQDRGCIGHSLELARSGQTVRWTNADTGVRYTLTPTRDFRRAGRSCRAFTARATFSETERNIDGQACRPGDGTWDLL